MPFLRKQVIHQMSYVNRNDMAMEKTSLISSYNINCYICASLDFVTPRAKSSERIRSNPAEVFLAKGVLKFAAYFLNTFS